MKLMSLALAGVVAMAAGAAQADVNVFADIEKHKHIKVNEKISVTKKVEVYVKPVVAANAVAEQSVVKNQRNEKNEITDKKAHSSNKILEEVGKLANGVLLFNQSSGHANNQGNELGVSSAQSAGPRAGVFAHASAHIQQINGNDNYGKKGSGNGAVEIRGTFSDTIGEGSFAGASGVVGVNQASNSLNNQNNAVSVAIGSPAVFALGEADLGQTTSGNYIAAFHQVRTDTIDSGAFASFSGIAAVNQSAGALNNQANVVTVAVSNGTGMPSPYSSHP